MVAALARLDRLPSAHSAERWNRILWFVAISSGLVGIAAWASQTLQGGVIALWAFVVSCVALVLVLPMPLAVPAPLFMGIAGWLVDMLPFVILVGWTATILRWFYGILQERRMPRGGRWIWLPLFISFWTAIGVVAITSADFKHFLLLLGIQILATGALLLVADSFGAFEDRVQLASGLVAFVVLLSAAVLLEWVGVPVQDLQNGEPRKRVESAYGVDAFPNNIGMIKYARSVKAGAPDVRKAIDRVERQEPDLPPSDVFLPKFQAYENSLVVRFQGSARPYERQLEAAGVELIFDNVGLAEANTVPRLRSFPRNALTYAGISAAIFPLALFLAWRARGRRRLLGRLGVAACLFGACFSLARGAWVAIVIGVAYLILDGVVAKKEKLQAIGAVVVAALVLFVTIFALYGVDPVTGRAGGGASVNTRADLYKDTFAIVKSKYIVTGYGTEQPRTESGTVKEGTRYVPRAGTHSTYLNYFFRTGLPGALAIIALYAIAILHARTAARERRGDEAAFASLSAMALVIAAAHAVILSLYVEPIYIMGVSILIGLAMAGNSNLGASVLPWRARRTS